MSTTLQPSAATFSHDGTRLMLFFDLPDGSRANLIATVDLDAYGGAWQTWRNGHCLERHATADAGLNAARKALRPPPRSRTCGIAPPGRRAQR